MGLNLAQSRPYGPNLTNTSLNLAKFKRDNLASLYTAYEETKKSFLNQYALYTPKPWDWRAFKNEIHGFFR